MSIRKIPLITNIAVKIGNKRELITPPIAATFSVLATIKFPVPAVNLEDNKRIKPEPK